MNDPSISTYVVGLTGGIGSGKSTVAALFADRGVEVIDADRIAKDLVASGTSALQDITTHFGSGVLLPDGNLNRGALRKRIFSDPEARAWLESLLHPKVRREINARLEQAQSPYVILMVPLLLESGEYDFVDRILVVDATDSTRISRVAQRDNSDEASVKAIIAAQSDRKTRLSLANDVIDNEGSLQLLNKQVSVLHEDYKQQARSQYQTG